MGQPIPICQLIFSITPSSIMRLANGAPCVPETARLALVGDVAMLGSLHRNLRCLVIQLGLTLTSRLRFNLFTVRESHKRMEG